MSPGFMRFLLKKNNYQKYNSNQNYKTLRKNELF